MKLEHMALCYLKSMTGLFLCVGLCLYLPKLTKKETGFIEKDSHNGYLVVLL